MAEQKIGNLVVVESSHLSQNPDKAKDLYRRQEELADQLEAGNIDPVEAIIRCHHLRNMTRTLEADVRARLVNGLFGASSVTLALPSTRK